MNWYRFTAQMLLNIDGYHYCNYQNYLSLRKCYEYFLLIFCFNEVIYLAKHAKISNVKIGNLF